MSDRRPTDAELDGLRRLRALLAAAGSVDRSRIPVDAPDPPEQALKHVDAACELLLRTTETRKARS